MKSSFSAILLIVLTNSCASSSAPAASPAAVTEPAFRTADSGHMMHHPPPAAEVESSADAPAPVVPPAAAAAPSSAPSAAGPSPSPAQPVATTSAKAGALTVTVTSTPANAAKQAVVYLEDVPKDREVAGSMDNRQMTFVPHVLVVTAGSKVTFSNSDPFPHNVFSPDNEKWDMGIIQAKGAKVRRFDKPGVYTVLCNMHPNMKAYIAVVPSSYFAKVSKSGELAIKDVPAGKHEVVIWAPGVKPEHKEVIIDGDKTLAVELHR